MELPLFDEFVTKSNKLQNQLKVFSSFFNVFPSRRLLEGDLPRLWILPRHIQADCRLRSQYKRLTLMILIIIMMPIIKMIIFTMTVVHIQGLWWSSTFPRVQHWLGNLPHTNLGQATVCRRPPENFRQVLHSFDETCGTTIITAIIMMTPPAHSQTAVRSRFSLGGRSGEGGSASFSPLSISSLSTILLLCSFLVWSDSDSYYYDDHVLYDHHRHAMRNW